MKSVKRDYRLLLINARPIVISRIWTSVSVCHKVTDKEKDGEEKKKLKSIGWSNIVNPYSKLPHRLAARSTILEIRECRAKCRAFKCGSAKCRVFKCSSSKCH